MRTRENLARGRARFLQLIQKSLMQMNLQLHNVVADVMGETVRRIITSLLAGERDPLGTYQRCCPLEMPALSTFWRLTAFCFSSATS